MKPNSPTPPEWTCWLCSQSKTEKPQNGHRRAYAEHIAKNPASAAWLHPADFLKHKKASHPAPSEAGLLAWSDPAKPNEECRYNHSIAQTPFGRFLLTWKGWKDDPGYGFDETPWKEIEYRGWDSVEAAQKWAEEEMLRRIAAFRPAAQPTPKGTAEVLREVVGTLHKVRRSMADTGKDFFIDSAQRAFPLICDINTNLTALLARLESEGEWDL
jgi:hypothetical protein